MADFWELYKHPLWQKKRLEILERAGYQCESCDDKNSQLHIHHSYYERDKKPWEYRSESLHCLCGECHAEFQTIKKHINQLFGYLTLDSIKKAQGAIFGLAAQDCDLRHDLDGEGIIPTHLGTLFLCGIGAVFNVRNLFQKQGFELKVGDLYEMEGQFDREEYEGYLALKKSIEEDYVIYA